MWFLNNYTAVRALLPAVNSRVLVVRATQDSQRKLMCDDRMTTSSENMRWCLSFNEAPYTGTSVPAVFLRH